MAMCKWGFPLDKIDLRMMVAAYLTKQKRVIHQFKNNIPGDDWASNFMKRWKLTHRVATNIRRKRVKLARTELETYFNNIKEVEGVPATNIWNYDEHNIAFICLFPNGTHLLQPLDVAYFAPLKKAWRALLFDWRKTAIGHQYGTLAKEQFAGLLRKLIKKLSEGNSKQNLVNRFKACGIHPFNPEEVKMQRHVQPGKSISENLSSESDESDEEREEDCKTEEESESQPETDEETQSEGESDTDTPTKSISQKEKLLQTLSEVNKSLDDYKKGRLYAVYYGQKYY
ncbi:Hypothetical predicted protein [Paramuricea clavata]|uniref:Uncharacterized protein n=1 Tax=Paramuricea clavata TaxID=317549 RepID=A0A6S7FYE4_PARCT|nr:Hypothetical predicted protein [Paramuricea clavata]